MALLTALVVAVLIPTASALCLLSDTLYMVTATSQMVGGTTETVCAHVFRPSHIVRLYVGLSLNSANVTILEETVSTEYYRCVTFQVPAVISDTVATIHVTLQGRRDAMMKKSKILIIPATIINIIRTDKPIYKPGQTLLFRIVSLDTGFLPVNRVFTIVELQDPDSNRIAQWLDRIPVSGITDFSFNMSPLAARGIYTINAFDADGHQTSQSFEIREYVLPKFKLTIEFPDVIHILDTNAKLQICGKYTYGQPVIGLVTATICRNAYRFIMAPSGGPISDICLTLSLTTDPSGCVNTVLNMTQFALKKSNYKDTFTVQVKLEESGTGVVLNGEDTATFSDVVKAVTFENVPNFYRPGILYRGQVEVTGPDSKPAPNQLVFLIARHDGQVLQNLTLTTGSTGLADFTLDTLSWNNTITLSAQFEENNVVVPYEANVRHPTYRPAYLSVPMFFSRGQSFVKVLPAQRKLRCWENATLHVQYIVRGSDLDRDQTELFFYYLVLSKGTVVQNGRSLVPVDQERSENSGIVMVRLKKLELLTPVAQVVVYTMLASGEIIADSINFPIQPCLKNKVNLNFSSGQALPGDNTTVNLQAYPGSLCSLRAIDLSVLLLKKEQELSVDSVFSLLPVKTLEGYPNGVEDDAPNPCLLPERNRIGFGFPRQFVRVDENNDIYSIFRYVGVKVLTNVEVRKPVDCKAPSIMAFNVLFAEAAAVPEAEGPRQDAPKETVRTYFPETWIWDLVPVGPAGSVSLEKEVPDTITTWVAGAFCTSPDVGLGLAADVELTAFQPFFVSLTLPYSVVHGESFTLKATVFNYLDTCIVVKVTLHPSESFISTQVNSTFTMCLCGQQTATFSWNISPTSLGHISFTVSAEALNSNKALCGKDRVTVPIQGRIDTVVQTLLVEAEGTPATVTYNALLCPQDCPAEKIFTLTLPDRYVQGSVTAFVSVAGDIMARALKNLDKLLRQPSGCGEQTMISFAPNVYILQYLASNGLLTKNIELKAKGFLESGYQRELTYKHNDGSYSAFGKRDASGNTWLTAFVMKSFGGARPFIYVDPLRITEARAWLLKQQRTDGCFNSVGRLIHTDLKGGVTDTITLTAYITAALLELNANDTSNPMVKKSLICLETALPSQLSNTYNVALLFYTFRLAGETQFSNNLINYLDNLAKTKGGTRHWESAAPSSGKLEALAVEMTAYVLLALLSGPLLPGFGLEYANPIANWLVQQQNSYGGFASTQDTVVALQALAKYAAATYRPKGSTVVTVNLGCKLVHHYTVDQSNRLLHQENQLAVVTGDYKIKAEGQSCVSVQIALHYNIPPPVDFSSFSIFVQTNGVCRRSNSRLTLAIHVRYNGVRNQTMMVIINVKLLSGYLVDQVALENLKADNIVKRLDVQEGYLNIYLNELIKNENKQFNIFLDQKEVISNPKPAVVLVYDYYQPNDQAATQYTSPC